MNKRVVRILIYEGDSRWLDNSLSRRFVKGKMDFGKSSITEKFMWEEELKDLCSLSNNYTLLVGERP